jgi:hypothetical protein
MTKCVFVEDCALMAEKDLHVLLRESEGRTLRLTLANGEEMLAEIVSASHVDEDDTVVVLRSGATSEECGWQLHLANIRSVVAADGQQLYRRVE